MPNNIFYTLQKSSYLDEKLQAYADSDCYPFHMPGHKRSGKLELPNPYSIDITEIEGFDNLHHAETILKEAQMRAAEMFGAKSTFYLVNGSTCGILSAISAALPRKGTLMSRNSHKSAYHAAYLRELETIYLLPAVTKFGISGSIPPTHVEQALEEFPQTGCIFLTSPTYDGIVSDIQAIADIAHAHNVPLIVDEAHGAHFMFSKKFPAPALRCGADVVIQSLHKTLPCLTQAALLHVNSKRIDRNSLKRFLGIYQTSSPSYLLMASIDKCIRFMREESAPRMTEFTQLLAKFYHKSEALRRLKVFSPSSCPPESCFAHDFSKILISVGRTGLTGKELYDSLPQSPSRSIMRVSFRSA